jgi:hypothetical protein
MTDYANIQAALNRYYYGRDGTVPDASLGIAREILSQGARIDATNATLDLRKPPALVVGNAASAPDTNHAGGIWVDTSTPSATVTSIAKYWDSTAGQWVALGGLVRTDQEYVWTAKQLFKSTINYFANDTDKNTAIPAPVTGQFAVVGSKLQVRTATGWSVISLPLGGTTGQVLSKASATDGDAQWSDILNGGSINTFTAANTFNGATTFGSAGSVAIGSKPTLTNGMTVTGAAATFAAGLTVSAGTVTFTPAVAITGNLDVAGAIDTNSTLDVLGATTLRSTVAITGATTIASTLAVSGHVDVLSGGADISGATTITGSVGITGNTTVTGALNVSTTSTLTGAVTMGSTASIAGTLAVTGAATLNNAITVTGAATLNGATVVKNDAARASGFFMGTRRVWVQSAAPTGMSSGDIWIQG